MVKRGRLEIMRDVMDVIKNTHNSIRTTPLLRRSNLSSERFKEYYLELLEKGFIEEGRGKGGKFVSLTEKGFKFLEKYRAIINFIDEFEL